MTMDSRFALSAAPWTKKKPLLFRRNIPRRNSTVIFLPCLRSLSPPHHVNVSHSTAKQSLPLERMETNGLRMRRKTKKRKTKKNPPMMMNLNAIRVKERD